MPSGSTEHAIHEAWERFPGGTSAPFVFTCEHATDRMPGLWAWPEADRWVRGTHWAWDPGAARITRALAVILESPAVLSRFTRLLVDPNRPEGSTDLVRSHAEGRSIALNAGVDDAEVARRLHALYQPFHDAIDHTLAATPDAMVVSIHTFTPEYQGSTRQMELGVLYDLDEDLAHRAHQVISSRGWAVGLNEPYSGRSGFMYSPHSHAVRHGRRALELEIRQDIAADRVRRLRVLETLWAALEAVV